MSPAVDTLHRAKRDGVRVTLDGEGIAYDAPSPPPPEILDDLARHKAAILDLLRNPACQQCGESDGMQELQDGVWMHEECAAYRRRRGIPWNATLDDLVRMTVMEVSPRPSPISTTREPSGLAPV
jgi:hypothetical protein